VPGFGGDVMMYAKSDDELREWIHDGVNKRKAVSKTWQEQRDKGALRMPAFGRVLSDGQINDLVAFVNATAGNPEPEDSVATAGFDRAKALGCFGCHGPGGRLAERNPGSLKGYVPSWDGKDWPELVKDRPEFDQWVGNGVSDRFRSNKAAMFFLKRAALHMPRFKDHLKPGDGDAIWAYIEWLRKTEH
jgi:mono/diheme cytochrome c family protein